MKKTIIFLIAVIFATTSISISTYAQKTGTFTDSRDGHVYKTVKIGDQVWMAENLNVKNFRYGDPIPHVKTDQEWYEAGVKRKPAWCYYDNDPENGKRYRKLYNWYAVNDPTRGLAPEGWHVPSDNEWKELEMALGMSQSEADNKIYYRGTNEGSKLAGNGGLWTDGTLENDAEFGTSGFTALPGGHRNGNGTFYYIGRFGYWWSSPEPSSALTWSWRRYLSYDSSGVYRSIRSKGYGFSVRCLRD